MTLMASLGISSFFKNYFYPEYQQTINICFKINVVSLTINLNIQTGSYVF